MSAVDVPRGVGAAAPPASSGDGAFARCVVAWQRMHGRHRLPWQGTRDPYRVWLSEIMLQQTQVATVLGYYERFLARFPDVRSLAAAPLDDVLALWSGLGYYGRARNLHRCAAVVAAGHGGEFPRDSAALQRLPGIGRSTAAAIAAFCFGERVAILDGNVKRVLARVLGFGDDLSEARHERALWQHATALLPRHGDIGAYTQGLMDLGAAVCTARSPSCLVCPASAPCVARREGAPERYPVKTRKTKRTRRDNAWLWLEHGGRVFLQRRPDSGVWAGLWTLPLFDDDAALHAAAARLGATVHALPPIDHALTHFDWRLRPYRADLARLPADGALDAGRWVAHADLAGVALPAPLRRLLASQGGGAAGAGGVRGEPTPVA